jgi:c-di-AMP phosphodiesterase-like protein
MKKLENRRNLAIFIAFLALVLVNCIANIAILNVFAIVIDMIMVIFICFVLGYNYCRYEGEKKDVVEIQPAQNEKSLNDVLTEYQKGIV